MIKEYVETLIGKYNDWIEEFPNKNDKGGAMGLAKVLKIRAFSITILEENKKVKGKKKKERI